MAKQTAEDKFIARKLLCFRAASEGVRIFAHGGFGTGGKIGGETATARSVGGGVYVDDTTKEAVLITDQEVINDLVKDGSLVKCDGFNEYRAAETPPAMASHQGMDNRAPHRSNIGEYAADAVDRDLAMVDASDSDL